MPKKNLKPKLKSENLAIVTTYPVLNAAKTVIKFATCNSLDLFTMTSVLADQTKAINSGGMESMESMLAAHAYSLDVMFQHLACRAKSNMDESYFNAGQAYLKMAFRAQAQAVRTIEALGELKNPRHISYVAQANIANGHQQINNGRAKEKQNSQNKLIEGASHDLPMDTGTAQAAGGAHQEMEAVGEINRPDNG